MLSRIAALVTALTAVMTLSSAAHAATLRAPSGLEPGANASVETVPPFTWGAVPGAEAYDFQLAADRGFGSIVDKGNIRTKNTAATVTTALGDATYYWRVRAIGSKAKAGRWTQPRAFVKAWTSTPKLKGPTEDGLSIDWPNKPAVLEWEPVPYAAKYEVIVATDDKFANAVVGSIRRPLQTQGTKLAVDLPLNTGRYFWAVTPIDAGNFRGRQSTTGTFQWQWRATTSGLRVDDTDGRAQIFDPVLTWNPISGAAKYEVEINPTTAHATGSRTYAGVASGPSFAPYDHLPKNTYDWRVRAIDSNGNAGPWNAGPPFKKDFSNAAVEGITVGDEQVDQAPNRETSAPFFKWKHVSGATHYELQFTRFDGGRCDYSQQFGDVTALDAWADGWDARPTVRGIDSRFWPATERNPTIFAGKPAGQYCMRILALDSAGNLGEWTHVNASGQHTAPHQPAFTYVKPTREPGVPAGTPCTPPPSVGYTYPSPGAVVSDTPYFRWTRSPGARSYWVIIARDAAFRNVVEVAFTHNTVYTPNNLHVDETTVTPYHWAVVPARDTGGSCPADIPAGATFSKNSAAPTERMPVDGRQVQSVFRWWPKESAHSYKIQVASDPNFGKILDDVNTASTSYTSAKAYPADTSLYWRVQARVWADVKNRIKVVGTNWSPTYAFNRELEVPVPSADNATGGEMIPILKWEPVPGAVSYDMNVLQSDGTSLNFANLRSTHFTPTLWWGTGVWTWRVRANFPGGARGGYFTPQSFVRRINAPQQVKVNVARNRMLFTWQPEVAAHKYRIQLSTTDSFTRIAEQALTPLTSWAPNIDRTWYRAGGPLWWRIAVVDGGNNTGAYTTGRVTIPKTMSVTAKGSLRRGRRGGIVVTALDANRKPISAAALRSSGAGSKAGKARTGRKGTGTLRIRATKRGIVKIRVIKRGWLDGTVNVRVR